MWVPGNYIGTRSPDCLPLDLVRTEQQNCIILKSLLFWIFHYMQPNLILTITKGKTGTKQPVDRPTLRKDATAGCGPTFWESTGTFGPLGLQRWWGVKGGHCAPGGAGHGGSRVWSFRFESLFAGAVHLGGGVYWSLHTLVWHL